MIVKLREGSEDGPISVGDLVVLAYNTTLCRRITDIHPCNYCNAVGEYHEIGCKDRFDQFPAGQRAIYNGPLTVRSGKQQKLVYYPDNTAGGGLTDRGHGISYLSIGGVEYMGWAAIDPADALTQLAAVAENSVDG